MFSNGNEFLVFEEQNCAYCINYEKCEIIERMFLSTVDNTIEFPYEKLIENKTQGKYECKERLI